jgi:protein dithiol oxidoreductase (disulfide-forming)
MNMKSKLWPVLAALLLAACGGGGEPVSQQPAAANDTAGAASAAAQPAGSPAEETQTGQPQQAAADEQPQQAGGQQQSQQARQQPARPTEEERAASAAAAAQLRDGVDYQRLSPQQPTSTDSDRVEVAEVFMYGCPACFQFEPYVQQWKDRKADYVDLVPIPAVFDQLARIHAQAYYTAEALGKLDEMHWEFYREIHVNNNLLNTETALARFFDRFGVDEQTFRSTFNSLGVQTRLRRAEDLVRRYRVTGTPTVVINGKYVTMGRMAGSYENWFGVIDTLAAAEWAEAGGEEE